MALVEKGHPDALIRRAIIATINQKRFKGKYFYYKFKKFKLSFKFREKIKLFTTQSAQTLIYKCITSVGRFIVTKSV